MGATVPGTFTFSDLAPGEFRGGSFVHFDDWLDIVQAENYLFSRSGLRLVGPIFNPPFETASVSQTSTNSAAGATADLDTWEAAGVLQRRIEVSGTKYYRIRYLVYGFEFDMAVTAVRHNAFGAAPTTLSTTTVKSTSGNAEWKFVDVDIAEAAAHVAGSTANDKATISFSMTCARGSGGSTAEVFQVMIYEPDLATADLPTS